MWSFKGSFRVSGLLTCWLRTPQVPVWRKRRQLDGNHIDFYDPASKVMQHHIPLFYCFRSTKFCPRPREEGIQILLLDEGVATTLHITLHYKKNMWDGVWIGSCSSLNFFTISLGPVGILDVKGNRYEIGHPETGNPCQGCPSCVT